MMMIIQYLKRTVEQYGFTTEWDTFVNSTPYVQNGRVNYKNRTFRNLIATYDPQNKIPRRLVVACHYDSKEIPG